MPKIDIDVLYEIVYDIQLMCEPYIPSYLKEEYDIRIETTVAVHKGWVLLFCDLFYDNKLYHGSKAAMYRPEEFAAMTKSDMVTIIKGRYDDVVRGIVNRFQSEFMDAKVV